MTSVFLAPHPDDEVLWGTFTLLRHKPTVICVLNCGDDRRQEFERAMLMLGIKDYATWPYAEANPDWRGISERIHWLRADTIYAPAWVVGGDAHHNRIAAITQEAHYDRVVNYCTYTTEGKQTSLHEVPYELDWIARKLRALACYPSQSGHPSHAPHFLRDQREFIAT